MPSASAQRSREDRATSTTSAAASAVAAAAIAPPPTPGAPAAAASASEASERSASERSMSVAGVGRRVAQLGQADRARVQRALGQAQALLVLRQLVDLELGEQHPQVALDGLQREDE